MTFKIPFELIQKLNESEEISICFELENLQDNFEFFFDVNYFKNKDGFEISEDLFKKIQSLKIKRKNKTNDIEIYNFGKKILQDYLNKKINSIFTGTNKNLSYKKSNIFEDNDFGRLACIKEIDKKINLNLDSDEIVGEKNLIYYCVYGDEYLELFNICISTLLKQKEKNYDILIITDEITKQKIKKQKYNVEIFFHLTQSPIDGVEASQNKIKIFNFELIKNYKKIMYLDCDIFAIKKFNKIFDSDLQSNVFYTLSSEENKSKMQFKSPLYGFSILNDCFISEMEQKNQNPFNAGQFLFLNSNKMKKHFDNLNWFMENWAGEYFFEQSFMNYYFCKAGITNCDFLNKYIKIYFDKKNINEFKDCCLIHVAGDFFNSKNKKNTIKKIIFDLNINQFVFFKKIKDTIESIKEKFLLRNYDEHQYKQFNHDLRHLNSEAVKYHFLNFSKKEKRIIKDDLYDKKFFIKTNNLSNNANYLDYKLDITKIKSKKLQKEIQAIESYKKDDLLLLVSHQNSLYGATHYLYSLYDFLKLNYPNKNVLIAETFYNKNLFKKYNVLQNSVIFYKNDPTLLYYIIKKLDPRKILINSINTTYLDIYKYIDPLKTIFYSHEIKNNYILSNFLDPDFVVSDKINNQYNYKSFVEPPFLSKITREIINKTHFNFDIKNKFGDLDKNKILIGMSGSTTSRKNPNLFIQLAQKYEQYNFIWIGGSKLDLKIHPKNFFHIEDVINPYGYYKILDYFLLTSEVDPCPYVVLENLYLNNKIITFKENIFTNHKDPLIENLYFEWQDSINLNSASLAIDAIVKEKKKYTDYGGRIYITNKYSRPSNHFLKKIIL